VSEANTKSPIFKYSRGQVHAAVFEQESRGDSGGSWLSVKIDSRYQDKDGSWRSSSNFRVADLSHLAHVTDVVDRWIVQRELKNQMSEDRGRRSGT
jgi:hypothetical protein